MAEILHEHDTHRDSNPASWIIGLIILLVLAFLIFYYGLPALNRSSSPTVQVPERVDINVNMPPQQ